MNTLLQIAVDMVNEVEDNSSHRLERVYISRELYEDLRLEVERMNHENDKTYLNTMESQAAQYLHRRNFPDGEPNNF